MLLATSQSLTVSDLLTLSSTPSKSIDNYLGKKGFVLASNHPDPDGGITNISFIQKKKASRDADSVIRTVDLYKKEDCYFFILNTSSVAEYENGCNWLKKNQFFYVAGDDSSRTAAYTFQKRNYVISTEPVISEQDTLYRISVRKKQIPEIKEVQYAEDLLRFDSHEYLISFFGERSVKKDDYYFSENELKKCSVLFPNTNQQAIFIWDDEENYSKLSYVLISGILPTMSAVQYTGFVSQNKWISKTGLYSGMGLTDLIKINNADINFYGRNSEFSFLIDPASKGNINFKKCGVMLGCIGCGGLGDLLDKEKINTQEAVERNLQLYIFYLMISK
jgi:hypothetical protein